MAEEVVLGQNVERARQAVLRRAGKVTIGDIMSETGLGNYEAKEALDRMIEVYEGVMRVSDNGELLYVFKSGCIRRDHRSWWQRNKDAIISVLKKIFKVIIFLVLVVYFIIYLLILLAILTSGRNNSRSSDSGDLLAWGMYIFWGTGFGDDSRSSGGSGIESGKQPLYTKVFNFVFGPEEPKEDPLEAKAECAQLIRARRGVITLRDWVIVSGQDREKCESDLARFTAEFDGNVEITDSGTIVYTFEEMMVSGDMKRSSMPERCWRKVVARRPLSGNIYGGDGAVIGLNLFNMTFAGIATFLLAASEASDMGANSAWSGALELTKQGHSGFIWLGLFPFVFSALIFAGPLVRMPGNIKENHRRAKIVIRKALLEELFGTKRKDGNYRLVYSQCLEHALDLLEQSGFNPNSISHDLISREYNDLCYEFHGEITGDTDTTYEFPELESSRLEVAALRDKLHYDKHVIKNVAFSTDNDEQANIEEKEERAELDAFSKMLKTGVAVKKPASQLDAIEAPQIQTQLSAWGQSIDGSSTGGDYDSNYGVSEGVSRKKSNYSEL